MHELPKLPYSYDALEPFIDAKTMEIHYSKHHATYVTKLNEALQNYPDLQKKLVLDLLRDLQSVPETIRGAVRNHGGGHANHMFFWGIMNSESKVRKEPEGVLAEKIKETFGDFAKFREAFTKVALGQFGSGWAWLVADVSRKLSVMSTPNQNSPVSQGFTPLLGIDVWEHSYYLKYQNRRQEYIEAWWNVVDWGVVEKNFHF